ncbi:MAG: shikimate dehydrogenase [Endomicrobia bacterium]|nr:shikimate dehydrogenase [Endomicrobiia bacterium]MCL2506801.1 shikimate dehydrogenase [Endomicrobiia bacterium]
MLNNDTKLFAILGFPIKHSFSPQMQNAWFADNKLNCAYISFETKPEKLKQTVEALKLLEFCGINVTIPHKTEIIKYLDFIDPSAKAIGSVNTINIKKGKLYGYNTDHSGLKADLISKGVETKYKKVFVFGAGGAARAVLYAVKDAKEIYISNRTFKSAQKLAKEFKVKAVTLPEIPQTIKNIDLIINASACGMSKKDFFPFKTESLKENTLIYDLIYNKITPFVKLAKTKRIKFFTGEGMLIRQGADGFKLWTGIYPDVKKALRLFKHFSDKKQI